MIGQCLSSDLVSFVVLLLLALLLASLFTVVERKALASVQRRIGPSYAGWTGLVQVAGDGLKLVYAWVLSGPYVLPIVGSLGFCYVSLSCYTSSLDAEELSLGVLGLMISLGFVHGCLMLSRVALANSLWTRMSILRLGLLVLLIEPAMLSLVLAEEALSFGDSLSSSSCCSLLSLVCLFWLFLMDLGRVPYDVIEAESELVAGIQTEYTGLLYALLASVEYTCMLVASLALLGLVGQPMIVSLPWFGLMVWVRGVMPRVRYLDMIQSILPASLAVVSCNVCLGLLLKN